MIISDKEYEVFLKTHLEFLYFIGQQEQIVTWNTTFHDFTHLNFKVKFMCRESFLEKDNLLDDYLVSHFDNLRTEQIKILAGFKKRIESDFIIYKCLKNHAIFIDIKDNKFYAVKALRDPFNGFFDHFPVLVKTTILPLDDKIIYDGFIQPTDVSMNAKFIQTMNEAYGAAKKSKRIATAL